MSTGFLLIAGRSSNHLTVLLRRQNQDDTQESRVVVHWHCFSPYVGQFAVDL